MIVNTNLIRLFERITGAKFRRIDDDGTYVFEHDFTHEVGYTPSQLEEEIAAWSTRSV